jgi:hypothetical protein
MENVDLGERKKVGRNDPCPCGSSKKYKKCCITSDERLDGRRVVERNGQRMLVSAGITDAQLAAADEFFEAKAAGRGPAADIAEFAAPLLDATDGSATQVQRALDMAMAFWNLAIIKDEAERHRALDGIVTKAFDTDDEREQFRSIATDMVERHRMMFPEMHEARA